MVDPSRSRGLDLLLAGGADMIASARRFAASIRRAAVRLDDSLLGDAIGAACLFVTIYILTVFAGVLS